MSNLFVNFQILLEHLVQFEVIHPVLGVFAVDALHRVGQVSRSCGWFDQNQQDSINRKQLWMFLVAVAVSQVAKSFRDFYFCVVKVLVRYQWFKNVATNGCLVQSCSHCKGNKGIYAELQWQSGTVLNTFSI